MEASANLQEKRKMPKTTDSKKKTDRGRSFSKQQYDLIFNFLKTGQKPNAIDLKSAGLTGDTDGDFQHPNTSSYFRFKSFAKRLSIREDDQELVFKANNKIVLPTSRFEEVIKKAHCNNGKKHLNITKTIEKVCLQVVYSTFTFTVFSE